MTQTSQSSRTETARLKPFNVSVQSGQFAVREALSEFLEALEPLRLDVEETGTIELVLAEILNNIVEHAYPPPAPSGPIDIHCAQHSDGLMVEITDRGSAMPDGQLPIGKLASLEVDVDDLPEGGFGWFLIQHLARDVTYDRCGNENHLRIRLAIGLAS